MSLYVRYYDSAVGTLRIESDGQAVTRVCISVGRGEENPCDITNAAVEQLDEYFRGERTVFDLPLAPAGTEFQKKVWNALSDIPFGETRSYADIAAAIGNAKACRAVGGANNKNPIMIIIPCHRVIGKNGSLVGYAGGTNIKKRLLELEGVQQ